MHSGFIKMRKKFLIVLIFVIAPVLIATPTIYDRMTEARRLKHLAELRESVLGDAQQKGSELESVLSGTISTDALVLAFTGNTRAHLEPCGCYIGQSGGVARRATAIRAMQEKRWNPIILDAGNFLDGTDDLSHLRSHANLDAMEQIGYAAIGIGSEELRLPDLLTGRATSLPLVWTNRPTGDNNDVAIPASRVVDIGGTKVAIFAFGGDGRNAVEAARAAITDVEDGVRWRIALSALTPEETRTLARDISGFDAILSATATDDETVRGTPVLSCVPEGELLDLAVLRRGGVIVARHRIRLTESVRDDSAVSAILSRFYAEIERNAAKYGGATISPLAGLPEEKAPGNAYVGSQACLSCHAKEYTQWSATAHARAFQTLKNVQRYYVPECVSCHVVGYGHERGYRIAKATSELEGVGCETCHGPGKRHTLDPAPENIRQKADSSLCLRCHNEKHSPDFRLLVAHAMKDVDHTRPPADIERILGQRVAEGARPSVELFVMSFCPWGTKAEKRLIPLLRKYGDKIEFSIRFIVSEKNEAEKAGSNDKSTPESASVLESYAALHGEKELIENFRQVIVQQLYPDVFLDYVLWRASHQEDPWRKGAEKYGINPNRVTAMMETPEGERLFLGNVERTKALSVSSSPTLAVDGFVFAQTVYAKNESACASR